MPGVGKTTIVQKVIEEVKALSIPVKGFVTAEVRSGGKRSGFDIISLTGDRGNLSRIGSNKPGPRVGQYVVDVKNFEHVALKALELPPAGKTVMVIDEIGKMELFSQTFIQVVGKLLRQDRVTLFGTIPIQKGKPLSLVEEIRNRDDVRVFTLSRGNRDDIMPEIFAAVQKSYKEGT
ncbi:putative cancer-related nucleoside-triphosphatase [Apostichopus japonicus]|uniref:Putative cancer-related nucleoside-triphosphatase n=1 Tax=Stichopus japonicus TaxID=307972 RepID=A0A2G8L9H3_STIJA|nr:putative cancer-related nucleoside-triphosphatase [Apostichopus japonicus]